MISLKSPLSILFCRSVARADIAEERTEAPLLSRASSMVFLNFGIAIAESIPIMTITKMSSVIVNAFLDNTFLFSACIFLFLSYKKYRNKKTKAIPPLT